MKLGGALTGYKRGLGDDAPETQVAEKRFDGVYDFLSLAITARRNASLAKLAEAVDLESLHPSKL